MRTGRDEPESPAEEKRQDRLRVLDLSAVGLAFPIALLLGYFAGRMIGGWLGAAQVGGLIGALVGIAAGFYNLLKMVSRLAPRTASGQSSGAPPPSAGSTAAGDASDHDEYDPLEDDFRDLDDADDERAHDDG